MCGYPAPGCFCFWPVAASALASNSPAKKFRLERTEPRQLIYWVLWNPKESPVRLTTLAFLLMIVGVAAGNPAAQMAKLSALLDVVAAWLI